MLRSRLTRMALLFLAGALWRRSASARAAAGAAWSKRAREDMPRDARNPVRPSGPEAMRDPPERWDRTDETGDQSFPASDPPSNY